MPQIATQTVRIVPGAQLAYVTGECDLKARISNFLDPKSWNAASTPCCSGTLLAWACHAQNNNQLLMGEDMKSILSLAAASLLAVSASVFAAAPQATPAPAPAPAATVVTPAPVVKLTRAERKAAKKQIAATEKMALAECKKMSGAEKKACKKEADAKEKAALAELKAKP